LLNYKLKDPKGELNFDNLSVVRAFEGSEYEHGFILVHTAMNCYSPKLVQNILKAIKATEDKDRKSLNEALIGLEDNMEMIL